MKAGVLLLLALLGLAIVPSPVSQAQGPSAASGVTTELERLNALYREAQAKSFGEGSLVELLDEATVRLSGPMFFLDDEDLSHKVLTALKRSAPPGMLGLVRDADGFDTLGPVSFVRAGAANTDVFLSLSPDDVLASLNDSLQQNNRAHPDGVPLEARQWVIPPRYNPETHHLIAAALIVPKSAPIATGGLVEYNGVAFGRDGYFKVSITTTLENARGADWLISTFLAHLTFRPGKGLDGLESVPRIATVAAQALGIQTLRRATVEPQTIFADHWAPILGGSVATVAAAVLALYAFRHRRREARRW